MSDSKIQRAYNRAAKHYNEIASISQKTGEQLLDQLQQLDIYPKRILDAGCGTGYFTKKLQLLYPAAEIIGVDFSKNMLAIAKQNYPELIFIQEDIAKMNIEQYGFDLIFCNDVLHWLINPKKFFIAAKQSLAAKGALLFSTFGPDTFQELRQAWFNINKNPRLNSFVDMHDLGDILRELHFADPVLSMEKIVFNTPDVITLLHSLQAMGSSFLGENNYFTRKELYNLQQAYAKNNSVLPVTSEVIYGHAFQTEQVNFAYGNTAGEVTISVAQLRASRNPKS